MKKEKTIRTHQRRLKNGKVVTVREHKVTYDAAEDIAKDALKKAKGAGSERLLKEYEARYNDLAEYEKDDFLTLVDDVTNGEWAEGAMTTWEEAKKALACPSEKSLRVRVNKFFTERPKSKKKSPSSFMDKYDDSHLDALRDYAADVMDNAGTYYLGKDALKKVFDYDQRWATPGRHAKQFKKFLKEEWPASKEEINRWKTEKLSQSGALKKYFTDHKGKKEY